MLSRTWRVPPSFWTRFCPAPIWFLRSCLLLRFLGAQETRGADQKKNDYLNPHRELLTFAVSRMLGRMRRLGQLGRCCRPRGRPFCYDVRGIISGLCLADSFPQ